jgi:hypothetical protein
MAGMNDRLWQIPEPRETSFQIDVSDIVAQQMKAALAAIEAGYDHMLREAYDAGYMRGSDDEAYNARGIGPHEPEPTYEEWRDAYIARHRHPQGEQLD